MVFKAAAGIWEAGSFGIQDVLFSDVHIVIKPELRDLELACLVGYMVG